MSQKCLEANMYISQPYKYIIKPFWKCCRKNPTLNSFLCSSIGILALNTIYSRLYWLFYLIQFQASSLFLFVSFVRCLVFNKFTHINFVNLRKKFCIRQLLNLTLFLLIIIYNFWVEYTFFTILIKLLVNLFSNDMLKDSTNHYTYIHTPHIYIYIYNATILEHQNNKQKLQILEALIY